MRNKEQSFMEYEKIIQLRQIDTEHEEALAELTEMILSLQEGGLQ